jgi:acyl-CoA reductase-like NAD-dependent aldehyde dehydrogenase
VGRPHDDGQSCTSVERLYVQEPIYDRFREALVRDVNRLRQETDRDGDADLGRDDDGLPG